MTKNGKLLVFEGPDGVGKSTIVSKTLGILREKGIPFGALAFPGKDPGTLGWTVDQIHHNPASLGIGSRTPLSLQALHIAAHLDHIEARILPALVRGEWFVLDRFWWSTWVYGTANAVRPRVLDQLVAAEQSLWLPVVPATLFLITRASAFLPQHTEAKFLELARLYGQIAQRAATVHRVILIENDSLEASIATVRMEIDRIANS
jgi:dTMP kinase